MRVRIAHASQSENGNTVGVAGDQTKREVLVSNFYGKWDFAAIHPDAAVRDKHAKYAEEGALNDHVGYNWFGKDDRNTFNKEAAKVGYQISKIKTNCNCDCSSFQNTIAVASGAPNVSYGSNGWTTSTMRRALINAGYIILTDSSYICNEDYAVRGAIYCREGSHTVCTIDNGSKYKETLTKVGLIKPSTETPKENVQTSTKEFKSYKVRVEVTDLNIRKGPGTNYQKTGKYTGKGVFTIVDESSGKGASKWGKLKSGAGWISLDYCKKI